MRGEERGMCDHDCRVVFIHWQVRGEGGEVRGEGGEGRGGEGRRGEGRRGEGSGGGGVRGEERGMCDHDCRVVFIHWQVRGEGRLGVEGTGMRR